MTHPEDSGTDFEQPWTALTHGLDNVIDAAIVFSPYPRYVINDLLGERGKATVRDQVLKRNDPGSVRISDVMAVIESLLVAQDAAKGDEHPAPLPRRGRRFFPTLEEEGAFPLPRRVSSDQDVSLHNSDVDVPSLDVPAFLASMALFRMEYVVQRWRSGSLDAPGALSQVHEIISKQVPPGASSAT